MTPFFYKIIELINVEISNKTNLDLSLLRVAESFNKGNVKRYRIGENESVIDDSSSINYWHFHRGTEITRPPHPSMNGVTLNIKLSFVLVVNKDNHLWNVLSAFSYDKLYSGSGVSGRMIPRMVETDFFEISKKWFPDQVLKAEKLQTEYKAIQVDYDLNCENVCNFCID